MYHTLSSGSGSRVSRPRATPAVATRRIRRRHASLRLPPQLPSSAQHRARPAAAGTGAGELGPGLFHCASPALSSPLWPPLLRPDPALAPSPATHPRPAPSSPRRRLRRRPSPHCPRPSGLGASHAAAALSWTSPSHSTLATGRPAPCSPTASSAPPASV